MPMVRASQAVSQLTLDEIIFSPPYSRIFGVACLKLLLIATEAYNERVTFEILYV